MYDYVSLLLIKNLGHIKLGKKRTICKNFGVAKRIAEGGVICLQKLANL